MHKAKTVLIISHFVTNSFVQLAVIASCIGFPRLDVSAQLMVVIPIAIDMITTAFTIKAAKEQLSPNEIVRYQFIDWPMAILGFFISIDTQIAKLGSQAIMLPLQNCYG